MNFSKLALGRQLAENVDPLEVAQRTRDNAATGGERQHQGTANLRQKQKQQASIKQKPVQSGTTYATENQQELRRQLEVIKERAKQTSNWREELKEAIEDNDQESHPYVDVMPPVIKREKKMLGQGLQAGKQKKDETEVKESLYDKVKDDGKKIVDKTKPVVGTRYNKPNYLRNRK